MSQTPGVSVVIPVYNVEDYLDRCLRSVLQSTCPDIEVLCVDDGSTDGSLAILQDWAARDQRITVISKPNGGLSSARNAGLAQACGKYVYFLDSDDYISPFLFTRCMAHMDEHDLDVVYFDGLTFLESDDTSLDDRGASLQNYYRRTHHYQGWFTGPDLFRLLRINREYRTSACLQMIRREYLLELRIRFAEGYIHEDEYYTLSTLLGAARAGCLPDILYYRSVRAGSIMTSGNAGASILGYAKCLVQILTHLSNHTYDHEIVKLIMYLTRGMRNNISSLWRDQLTRQDRDALMISSDSAFPLVYDLVIAQHQANQTKRH